MKDLTFLAKQQKEREEIIREAREQEAQKVQEKEMRSAGGRRRDGRKLASK